MNSFFSSSNRTIWAALGFALIFNTSIYATKVDLEQRTSMNVSSTIETLLKTTEEALLIWVDNEITTLRNFVGYYPAWASMVQQLTPMKDDFIQLMAAPAQARLRQDLSLLLTNKGYLSFYLLSADFTTLAAHVDSELGRKRLAAVLQQPKLLTQLQQGQALFVNHLLQDGSDRRSQLYIVQALLDSDKQVLGYFLFELNPALQFSKMLHLGRFGSTGETYAFDQQGRLLSDSRFVSSNRGDHGVLPVRLSMARTRSDNVVVKTKPLAAIHQGRWHGIDTEGYLDYRNIDVVGAWQWLEALQLGLVTEIDSGEAFFNLNETKIALAASQVLTNVLLLFTTLLNLRRQEQIRRFTLIDPLTEIGNRKYLETELGRILNEGKRNQLPATVMMLDIDKFKPYNDEFGHPQGDVALKQIATAIKLAVPRSTDIVARYGGEEFCVVLPFTDGAQAQVVANKILAAVAAQQLTPSSKANHSYVSISVGYYSAIPDAHTTPQQCLQLADVALYQAKALLGNIAVRYQVQLQRSA
ncbi:sensor domain-containing diguanylate cyclase [uncultured Ferrimonas sp.]|uniref:sensor domain-containing diguanylate cyclase n=1 Tax=uncultured Ferrimonas sp. TaxID=432640 RepID=UPI00262A2FEB|nr:sensor domain-containing diguanylate cyclase [uncultured Ferrimonas sp.]